MSKISVVVPCYKVEKYLGECIESILGQTLTDLELILIDDGSPDNSGSICDEYAAKDKRIHVVHKANGGVSAARNDGLSLATGEYVIFVDSDDVVPQEAYESMYMTARKTNADIVIGDVYKIYEGGKKEYCDFYKNEFVSSDPDYISKLICADFYKNYCPDPPQAGPAFGYGGPWNKLVRRQLLCDNGISFDVRVKGLFDDIIYTAHILANAKTVAYIKKPVYYYRILEGSITQTFKKEMPQISNAILNSFNEFMRKYGSDGRYNKAFYALTIRMMSYSLPRYYCNANNTLTLRERKKELKRTMSMDNYQEAAKNVERNILTNRQKILAYLIRFKAAGIVVSMYK